ncbi:MAG: HAMP domain-containing protein [Burkholderiales bacterium]|nr:HAMP domain-containing protein [Anaerolineae bacterium]
MMRFDWRRSPLAVKLISTFTITVVLAVIGVTVLSIRREQLSFETELRQQGSLVLEAMSEIIVDALYNLDADFLEEVVEQLSDSELIISGHVFDANGRLIADTETVAELVFGLDADPFGARLLASDEIIVEPQTDRLVVGQSIILGRQKIGALSIALSREPLIVKTIAMRDQGILVAVAATATGMLLAWLFSRTITKPIEELTLAAQRIRGGDLSYTIELHAGVELETLAEAFNDMTTKLRETIDSLEQRVTERTLQLSKTNEQLQVEIADRANAQKDLALAHEQTKEALRLKTQILANVSHDARTPLSAIVGYSEILAEHVDGNLNEQQQNAVTRIAVNADQLLRFINNLLDTAQMEANKLQLSPTDFALTDLVDVLESNVSVSARAKGLDFAITIDQDVPLILNGDFARLEQIILNLVTNAIKFTERGKVAVRVYLHDAEHWAAAVSDTGSGIPLEAQAYIFEAFWQVDGSASRSQNRGVGLGLSIVRQLVIMMGGQMHLDSELGRGSTFTLVLPLVPFAEGVQG